MKTNKILIAGVATTALLALSISGVSAYGGGQGGGQGFGKTLTTEQRAELQAMPEDERQAYVEQLKAEAGYTSGGGQGKGGKEGKHNHNPADMIVDIEPSDVDATEIDLLMKQYEEEMMANELYTSFYETYGVETFKNIAESEAQHMEAIQALLDRYELDTPTSYNHIQSLYDDLKAKGALSLKDALEVGVSIEIVDIDDIITAIKASDNDDIRTVLVNIGGASYNHMRGFVKALSNNNLTTDIDYSDYLTADDVDTKGPIKVKLAEKLEAEGMVLPEGATSQALKEKCENEQSGNNENRGNGGKGQQGQGNNSDMDKGQGQGNGGNMNKGQRGSQMSNPNRYANSNVVSMKAQYKDSVESKYGSRLDVLNDSQLEVIVEKIDDLIEKVNTGDYSVAVKEKYIALLYALRDVTLEKMSDVDLDTDLESLFN